MKHGLGRKNIWTIKQVDDCVKRLGENIFENHIDTNDKTIYDTVEIIAMTCKLELIPDDASRLRKFINRTIVQIKSIVFD
jgi:hypothetical protein